MEIGTFDQAGAITDDEFTKSLLHLMFFFYFLLSYFFITIWLYIVCTLKGWICDLLAFTKIDIFLAYTHRVFGRWETFMPDPSTRIP